MVSHYWLNALNGSLSQQLATCKDSQHNVGQQCIMSMTTFTHLSHAFAFKAIFPAITVVRACILLTTCCNPELKCSCSSNLWLANGTNVRTIHKGTYVHVCQ